MQAKRQHGRGEKFAEGRLKLTTSCVECHRRKQKCDQGQPCRNCSRRFPVVECKYRSTKGNEPSLGVTKEIHSGGTSSGQPLVVLAATNTSDDSRGSNFALRGKMPQNLCGLGPKEIFSLKRLSAETLESFNSGDYQQLLDSMVSTLSSRSSSSNHDSSFTAFTRSAKRRCPEDYSANIKHVSQLDTMGLAQYNPDNVPPPSSFSITSVDPLHFLGVSPTAKSAELFQAFMNVITKYVVSIDGNPTPNYYNDHYVPWSAKSPLLVYLGIFTAACYQAEAQKNEPGHTALVLQYKLKAISLLNDMLRKPETATCDEAITGVMFLVTNEWYWSNFETIQAHMKGLREMIRLRGGLDKLGGEKHFLRNMVLLTDYHIAASYNTEPWFPHQIPPPGSYPPFMGTPFVKSGWAFITHHVELQISKNTAVILDDMQFMIMAILDQVNREPTSQELAKLSATSTWIQNRIQALPLGYPDTPEATIDHVYISCRLAALIYCRAIVTRTSLSRSCTRSDLDLLWANMWKVKLTRWKQIPGIFLFIILSAIPAAQETPHGRFLKSMLKTTSSYVALDYWDVADGSLMAFVNLQKWLGGVKEGFIGGNKVDSLEFFQFYGR